MSRYYKRYFSDETTEKIKEVLAGAGIDICNDAVESELYRMIQDGTKYSERCFTLQRMFKPTDEDFQKIIRMNDVLHERFTEAWNQMLEMKRQLDSDMQEGRLDISGYFMRAEFYFCYNYSQLGVPTADGESLMRFSDAADIMFPQMELTQDSKIPDLEKDILCYNPEKSWNVGWFDYPQLKGHYLYKYMHSLFEESLAFCPMDIRYIKPEDLEWQIDVDYEYYSKEQHKVDPKYKTSLTVTEHIKTYPWNYIPFYGHGYDYCDGIYNFIYYVAEALSNGSEKGVTLVHRGEKISLRGFGSDAAVKQMLKYIEHPFIVAEDFDFKKKKKSMLLLIVNMLSSYFKVEVYKNGTVTHYVYKDGILQDQGSNFTERENGIAVEYIVNPKYTVFPLAQDKYKKEEFKRIREEISKFSGGKE